MTLIRRPRSPRGGRRGRGPGARPLRALSRPGTVAVQGDGTGHDGNGPGRGVGLGGDDADAAAEALDVDAVGDFEDVGHVVADEDDAEAAVPQVLDESQHLPGPPDAE